MPKIEIAFRKAASLELGRNVDAKFSYQFEAKDYSVANLQTLKKEMQHELVKDGLFEDEAAAMLATWENSYFRNSGTRVFFVVPKSWTSEHLPLNISITSNMSPKIAIEIERTMVGRIELYNWPSPFVVSQSQ